MAAALELEFLGLQLVSFDHAPYLGTVYFSDQLMMDATSRGTPHGSAASLLKMGLFSDVSQAPKAACPPIPCRL
jgi:hypothetical protein